MPTLNEGNAIRFLRALLNWPPIKHDDREPDPGWCCHEHALVSAMAFLICGHRALECQGRMLVGDRDSAEVLSVNPHSFIFVEQQRGFFDSSIRFGAIEGIPLGYPERYAHLAVHGGKFDPTREQYLERLRKCGKRVLAWYDVESSCLLDRRAVKWESKTPIGLWLSERYSSQVGLWAKAGWHASRALHDFSFPENLNRDALWDFVNETPNKDEIVIRALESYRTT